MNQNIQQTTIVVFKLQKTFSIFAIKKGEQNP